MSAYAIQARPIAVELHALLRDLDPARWRDDMEAAFRERVEKIRAGLTELRSISSPDEGLALIAERISELEGLLAAHAATLSARVAATREEWMGFRARLLQSYDQLARSLCAEDVHVPALRPTNYRRNALHACSGLVTLAVIAAVPSPSWLRAGAAIFFVYAWCMELLKRRSSSINDRLMAFYGPVAHPHEWYRVNSATWYCTALMALALIGSPVVGAVGVLVLAFGDPAAALVGRRWGRTKLAHGRSLEGSLTFVGVSWAVAFCGLAVVFPEIGAPAAALLAAAGAISGAVAELFSRRIDDNLSIPVVAGVVTWAVAVLAGVPLG